MQTEQRAARDEQRKSAARRSLLHLGGCCRAWRLGRKIFEPGGWQDRWTIMFMAALLDFHFGKEHRGRNGGNRHAAGFGAADTVENVLLVACGYDPGERGERGADNIHAADEFVGAAVGINFVNDDGENLEGLRQLARGQRKAALNVVEVESVRLVLFFDLVDKFLAHISFR